MNTFIKLVNILNNNQDIINIIISILLLITTANLYIRQSTILKKNTIPYPFITSIVGRFLPSQGDKDKPILKQYCHGFDVPRSNYIPKENIIPLHENDYHHRLLIKEATENKNSVYFSMFNKHKCLVLNTVKNPTNFLFEFCSGEIHFVNYGALLHNMSLVGAKVYFSEKKKPLILKASKQKNISSVLQDNEETILICQLVDDLKKMFCITDKEFIKNHLDGECQFFTDVVHDKVFNYKKIYIYLKCQNIYNHTFYFKMSVEKHGNYFIPDTKRVHFLCKLMFLKSY